MDKLVLQCNSDYYRNVYYNPDSYGLRPVAEIGFSSGSYEFDLRVVWADAEGRLWTARDSGCSCPTPFDNVGELDRVFNFDGLQQEYENDSGSGYVQGDAWREFRKAVLDALDALAAASAPPVPERLPYRRFRF